MLSSSIDTRSDELRYNTDILDLDNTTVLLYTDTPRERIPFYKNILMQAAIEVVGNRNPLAAIELNKLVNNPLKIVREKVVGKIEQIGGSSMIATSGVVAAMLKDERPEMVIKLKPAIKVFLAQHAAELIPDKFDMGVDTTSERAAFFRELNTVVIQAILQQEGFARVASDQIHWGDMSAYEESPGKWMEKKITASGFGTGLLLRGIIGQAKGLRSLRFSEVVGMHIDANQAVHDYLFKVNSPDPNSPYYEAIKKYDYLIIDALAKRYEAVQFLINGADPEFPSQGYEQFNLFDDKDLEVASTYRERAIMIELTMGMTLREMAMHDRSIAKVLDEDGDYIYENMRIAGKLIGLWNDCGTPLLRMAPDKIEKVFEYLQTLYPNKKDIREILAPRRYVAKLNQVDASTSEIAPIRSEFGGREELWKLLQNLVKDSAYSEHNIFLDSGGRRENDFEYRKSLAIRLANYAQGLELRIGDQLRRFGQKGLPYQRIGDVLINAVRYHAHMYMGEDYYSDKNDEVLAMPILNGVNIREDFRLLGSPRES